MPIASPSESVTPAETRSSEPVSMALNMSSTAARDARATSGTDRLTFSSAPRTSATAAETLSRSEALPLVRALVVVLVSLVMRGTSWVVRRGRCDRVATQQATRTRRRAAVCD
jgi:hypothetical protein